jgi:hypothetical protein
MNIETARSIKKDARCIGKKHPTRRQMNIGDLEGS